jgi:hypothetical protein
LIITGKTNYAEWQCVIEILSKFEFDVDSYEQPIERPIDYKFEKKHYSGKQEKPRLKK